ncbi:hypothetical protein KM043_013778 [Ampulex compressa]|nr:hypothetical protein KM043_013778 [Ampulex compressa]
MDVHVPPAHMDKAAQTLPSPAPELGPMIIRGNRPFAELKPRTARFGFRFPIMEETLRGDKTTPMIPMPGRSPLGLLLTGHRRRKCWMGPLGWSSKSSGESRRGFDV